MSSNATQWITPVKNVMIKEEENILKLRVTERSLLISKTFSIHKTTLLTSKSYIENILNNKLIMTNNYSHYYSPELSCPNKTLFNCNKLYTYSDLYRNLLLGKTPTRKINTDTSVWYKPSSILTENIEGNNYESGKSNLILNIELKNKLNQ